MELRWSSPRLQCAILVALVVFPLIYAGAYYRDDATRALQGVSSWGWLGRPLADLVMHTVAISAGWLSNISPLPQIIAGVFLYATCLCVSRSVFGKESSLGVLASFAALATPFAIECLLYRYDSLPMMLALYLAALAFRNTRSGVLGFITPVVLLIASLSLYQAQSNLYICLSAICFATSIINDRQNSFRDLTLRICAYASSMTTYYVSIFRVFSSTARDGSIIADDHGIEIFIRNLVKFWESIASVLMQPAYLVLLVVLSIIAAISSAMELYHRRNNVRVLIIAVIIISPGLILAASAGPLILIKEGFSSYRLMGSALTSIILLAYISSRSIRIYKFCTITVAAICCANVSSAFSVGAAVRDQRAYEDSILQNVSSKIDSNWSTYSDNRIYVVGDFDISPMSKRRNASSKMINTLVTPSPYWVSSRLLIQKGVRNVYSGWINPANIVSTMNCNEFADPDVGSRYKIYQSDGKAFVLIGDQDLRCKRSL